MNRRIQPRPTVGHVLALTIAFLWLVSSIRAAVPATNQFPLRCTVILQTRPDRLYAFIANTPVRVNLHVAAQYGNGEILELSSSRQTVVDTNLLHPVLTLLGTKVRRLGQTNLPPPLRVMPAALTNGLLNYRRVAVVGRVTSHEVMYFVDRYIEILLAEGRDGVPFRVEVLDRSNARERMPVGTEVEFVGLSYAEVLVDDVGPEAQIDLKNFDECTILRPAPWLTLERARTLVASAAVLAFVGGIWLVRERSQIGRLRAAERVVRQLNTELEGRVAQRTVALEESEAKFRVLFESSGHAVIVHDDRAIIDCNPAALRIFGYQRRDQLIGRHPSVLSAPVQPDGEASEVAAARHTADAWRRGSHQYEWLSRRMDGAALPVEVFLTPLQLNGRGVVQALVHDISARKQAEAEMQGALLHAKELSELKSRFVSMVSHEFRTPLGIIMSSAEILDAYLERLTPEDRRANLRDIAQSSKHMAGMMEEVLLLGRVEAGKMACNPTPLDLGVLCARLVDEVTSATTARCHIELKLGPALGESVADESLLRHILTNLLSNAVKYSPVGATVQFSVEAREHLAIFSVCDHGIGISDADQRQLFQAFHRGRNVGETPGTGLGMVIVKHCVQLHGGKIAFESREGRGSTFVVALPAFRSEGVVPRDGTQIFRKLTHASQLTSIT